MATDKHADTLRAAQDGFKGQEFDQARHGMFTSSMHAAFCLGRHLRDTGRSAPRGVRPGRGDLMHANEIVWRLNWASVQHPTITRET